MSFKRIWDDSCPREWDRWEQDGTTYVIQDLPPEDDDVALKILVEELMPEEWLFASTDLPSDPESVRGLCEAWMETIEKRTSLACYAEEDGQRKLVALNICVPKPKVNREYEAIGKKWKNVYEASMYVDRKAKPMEALGLNLAMNAYGLVVIKNYRRKGIGYKLLMAREPLSLSLGIKGATTLFTNIAAQKSATRAGFKSIAELPIKELAEVGFDFPKDDERLIRVMIKKYE